MYLLAKTNPPKPVEEIKSKECANARVIAIMTDGAVGV